MRLLRVTYPKAKREKPRREFLPLLGPFDPRQHRKPKAEREDVDRDVSRVHAVCAWLDSEP